LVTLHKCFVEGRVHNTVFFGMRHHMGPTSVENYRSFRGICCTHLQVRMWKRIILISQPLLKPYVVHLTLFFCMATWHSYLIPAPLCLVLRYIL